MSNEYWVPRMRDLPLGRVKQRKDHLLAEITCGDIEGRRFARTPDPCRAPRRRRLVAALAVAVTVGILFAAPALGLRSALLDFLGRSDVSFADAPVAASVIKRQFDDMATGAPKGMNPQVIAGQTRVAGTFTFGGSQRRIWVAPTATGGFCYVIEGVSGGCRSPHTLRDALELDGGFVLRHGTDEAAMDEVAGKVFDASATALRLRFEDGKTTSLPFFYVSAPIDAGFFAYKPTRTEEQPGHRPTELALLRTDGTVVDRETFDWSTISPDAVMKRERLESSIAERAERTERRTRP